MPNKVTIPEIYRDLLFFLPCGIFSDALKYEWPNFRDTSCYLAFFLIFSAQNCDRKPEVRVLYGGIELNSLDTEQQSRRW